ncbi:MAG: hypothetical protein RL742_782 [Bacteroidota bacterium]|jgi:hypothetical protein
MFLSNEPLACAAVLLACRRADEITGNLENAAFAATIRSRNIFLGTDPEALIAAAEACYAEAGSPAALLDAAAEGVREQTRLPLFYHCLDVMFANGLVTPKEHQLIQHLKGKFRIDDETVFKALEVLTVKNKL